ncbi:MAG: hypothetical protein A2Z71_07995 [Chloroflexi bacterium RBG_13_50_21]|nr:MAG: hypothetical protein A2Z71_07995 [Chloroflexi bacterium RBG_13_50_21]OGO63724.1 MAG: hypothetical protein A2029_11265 [Chloroflexi bacterium RBG_19FT_COMBO_47_9]
MRIKRNKHVVNILFKILFIATIILQVAACSSTPTVIQSSPSLAPYPDETTVTTQPTIAISTPSPVPSVIQNVSVPCFATYYDPFAFLPDSMRLLVRGDLGVQQFNLETMRSEKFIQAPDILSGPTVALSPGGILAWAFDDGTIQLIRLPDQELINKMQSNQPSPIKLEFSSSKDMLYSGSSDGWVQFWDLGGNQRNAFRPVSEVMNIALSPNGNVIAVIPSDGPVELFNVEDLNIVRVLGGSGGYDTSDAVFSPDGKYLAADLATGLHIWRTADGKELLDADTPIYSMAVVYSPDGKYLAYADINNIVLSSPDSSREIRTFQGHQAPIFELIFSPDSSILVSADDMEIRVWRVEDGELLAVGKRECR